MILTKKEQKNLINAIQYGLTDIIPLIEQADDEKKVKSLAGIIDIFQVLLQKFNNAEIKDEKQERIF